MLQALSDQNEHNLSQIEDWIVEKHNVTEDERNETHPSSSEKKIRHRISLMASRLRKEKYVERVSYGVYRITDSGMKLVSTNVPISEDQSEDLRTHLPNSETLEADHESIMQRLVQDLLAEVKNLEPSKFENLVMDLMKSMGYGTEHQVTPTSHDGGIDGIVKMDKLGLDEIFLQAKRYDASVPLSAVRDFVGSLQAQKNKKGVFITTSSFSKGTREYLAKTASNVVLIDGSMLAKYMVKYDTGVKTIKSLPIKVVDESYFIE